MNEHPLPGAFTVTEFCRAYGIGRTYFYEQVKTKKLAIRKAGTKTLVLYPEAERWAQSLPSPSSRSGL